jgi:Asp-tRNA(Asn)/Glu-tRNA(Gln) amidotransferase A subunit family amidase
MEQPTIENLELTTQQDGSTDTRRSAARIAVVQFNPQVGVENLECNMRAVTERLEQAAAQRADVIVLPELATTGYTFNSRAEAYAHAEKVPTGHTIQAWEGFSKKHQVYIVGCLPELDGSQPFDTAVLIGPDGYIGKYRKTHLWNEEKLFFTPGNLATETIEELARALRSQVKTSRDLVENALSSIKRLNPQLNGFSSIDETGALASADRVDQELCSGRDRGLLHGIPIAIKDIIDVAGQKTTFGSALYVDRYAEKDAEVVRLLREAGAIIIGKTVLHEFAYGATCDRSVHGASRNPYDPTRMSGGSSGGGCLRHGSLGAWDRHSRFGARSSGVLWNCWV